MNFAIWRVSDLNSYHSTTLVRGLWKSTELILYHNIVHSPQADGKFITKTGQTRGKLRCFFLTFYRSIWGYILVSMHIPISRTPCMTVAVDDIGHFDMPMMADACQLCRRKTAHVTTSQRQCVFCWSPSSHGIFWLMLSVWDNRN